LKLLTALGEVSILRARKIMRASGDYTGFKISLTRKIYYLGRFNCYENYPLEANRPKF